MRSYGQGYRWFGFGGGSHRCRGEQFAYVQIKTIWAYLLRNFDMKLSTKLPEPDYTAMVVGPLKPYVRALWHSRNI
jgi:sterol 14-demethylase